MTDLYYRLALHRAPGVGPCTFRRLLDIFGNAENVLRANTATLRAAGITAAPSLNYFRAPDWRGAEADLAWNEAERQTILTNDDPRFPRLLNELPGDGAPILFIKGNIDVLQSVQIAVVGTRKPSASGREIAHTLSEALAHRNITITSGLALGIDAAAHQGAIAAHGRTIAVAATGLDRVYPTRHRALAEQILQTNGALVSEFPLGCPPKREHFPRRNRIISGLSVGTLVVEAALRSGSLITARLAAEQGRDVFAVPGSIFNPMTQGCHFLLKQGAKLVEGADDIIEEIDPTVCTPSVELNEREQITARSKDVDLSGKHDLVFNKLGYEPTPVDKLIERTGLAAEEVSSVLMELELQGLVNAMSGGLYIRQG